MLHVHVGPSPLGRSGDMPPRKLLHLGQQKAGKITTEFLGEESQVHLPLYTVTHFNHLLFLSPRSSPLLSLCPQVTATFSITLLSPTSLSDSHFGCSQSEGPIQPHASARIKILYAPSVVNAHPSMGFFSVKALGGLGSTTLKCVGKPTGGYC